MSQDGSFKRGYCRSEGILPESPADILDDRGPTDMCRNFTGWMLDLNTGARPPPPLFGPQKKNLGMQGVCRCFAGRLGFERNVFTQAHESPAKPD